MLEIGALPHPVLLSYQWLQHCYRSARDVGTASPRPVILSLISARDRGTAPPCPVILPVTSTLLLFAVPHPVLSSYQWLQHCYSLQCLTLSCHPTSDFNTVTLCTASPCLVILPVTSTLLLFALPHPVLSSYQWLQHCYSRARDMVSASPCLVILPVTSTLLL